MTTKLLLLPLHPEGAVQHWGDGARPTKRRESDTNQARVCLDFQPSAAEPRGFWTFPLPDIASLDALAMGEDITLRFRWKSESAASGNVQWGARAVAIEALDAADSALSAQQASAPYAYSSAVTGDEIETTIILPNILSSAAPRTRLVVQVARLDASGQLADTVSLVGGVVEVTYTTNEAFQLIDYSDAVAFWPMNESNVGSLPHLDALGTHDFPGRIGFPLTPARPPWNQIEGVGLAASTTSVAHADFRITGDITIYHEFCGGWSSNHFIACYDSALGTDPLWGVGSVASLFAVWDKASDSTVQRLFGNPYPANNNNTPAIPLWFRRLNNVWDLFVGDAQKASLTGFSGARAVGGSEALVMGHAGTGKAFAKVGVWNTALSNDRIKAEMRRRFGN